MKDSYNYSALGERIRNARKQKQLTQEALAEACNLSTAHIGHIERGTRALSIESLITISKVLEVSTDYLLMNISKTESENFSDLLAAANNIDNEKYNKLIPVFKILIDNIDKL